MCASARNVIIPTPPPPHPISGVASHMCAGARKVIIPTLSTASHMCASARAQSFFSRDLWLCMDCSRRIELRNLAQIDATHTNSFNSENLQRAVVTQLDGLPANESILRKSFKLQILAWNHQRVVTHGFLASNVANPGIRTFSKFYKKIEPRVDATMDHLASAAEIHLYWVLLAQTLIAKDHMTELGTLQSWLRNPPCANTSASAGTEVCSIPLFHRQHGVHHANHAAVVHKLTRHSISNWLVGRGVVCTRLALGRLAWLPRIHLCASTFFHPFRYNRCCQKTKEVKQCHSLTKREVWNRGWVYSLRTLRVTILFGAWCQTDGIPPKLYKSPCPSPQNLKGSPLSQLPKPLRSAKNLKGSPQAPLNPKSPCPTPQNLCVYRWEVVRNPLPDWLGVLWETYQAATTAKHVLGVRSDFNLEKALREVPSKDSRVAKLFTDIQNLMEAGASWSSGSKTGRSTSFPGLRQRSFPTHAWDWQREVGKKADNTWHRAWRRSWLGAGDFSLR